MKYRWALCGAATSMGVAVAPWLNASLELMILLLIALLLLLVICRNELLLPPLFLILGFIAVEQRENTVPENDFLIGRVALISGREALVESSEGRVLMWFSDAVPRDDSWIVVRYQRSLPTNATRRLPFTVIGRFADRLTLTTVGLAGIICHHSCPKVTHGMEKLTGTLLRKFSMSPPVPSCRNRISCFQCV